MRKIILSTLFIVSLHNLANAQTVSHEMVENIAVHFMEMQDTITPLIQSIQTVFTDRYTLMPLGELEGFIAANGHLPHVPSAAAVDEDGVDVGEMNKVLLQKVEELTPYIIDLQKQIDELKSNK